MKLQETDLYSFGITFGDAMETIRKQERRKRKEQHYSQKELARRSGVSLGSLQRFEQTGEISLRSLLNLAMVLDCLEDFVHLFEKTTPLTKEEFLHG
jgi:transcriptional regulator with XRE-family HTH domain